MTSALKTYLLANNISQAEAGRQLGWRRQRVCFIVSGRHDETKLAVNSARHIAHQLMHCTLDHYWQEINANNPLEWQYPHDDPEDEPTLRELRERRGLSQAQILDTPTVSHVENGLSRQLTLGVAASYAKGLQVSLEWMASALERPATGEPRRRQVRERDADTPGGRLCQLRKERGLSLAEVGRRLNGSCATRILDMETNKREVLNIRVLTALDLAQALDMDVDALAAALVPGYVPGTAENPGSLRGWRQRERLTTAQMAERIGVAAGSVSRWEGNGGAMSMTFKDVIGVASLSGVPVSLVMDWAC